MIAALLGQWRWGLAGLIAVALLIAGWTVKAKFVRAAEADRLERLATEINAKLTAEREAHRKSEDARVLLSAQIADFEEGTRIEVREIIKRVPVLVNNGADCALGPDVVRLLNRARGYGMPGSTGGAASAAPAPSATP